MKDFQIVTFDSKYSNSFFELNKSWIEEHWSLEDSDIAISESSKDQCSSIQLLFNSKNELEYLESKVTI